MTMSKHEWTLGGGLKAKVQNQTYISNVCAYISDKFGETLGQAIGTSLVQEEMSLIHLYTWKGVST